MGYYFTIYLLIINIATLLVRWIDKYKALHEQYRIPEKILLIMTACGGGVGAYIGMKLLRHKTTKDSFLWKFRTIVVGYIIGILIIANW